MGHRPTDIEPVLPMESMSRPAELVQRAKQLAQLTNLQFGRGTVNVPQQPGGLGGGLERDLERAAPGTGGLQTGTLGTMEESEDEPLHLSGGNGNGHISRLEIPKVPVTTKTTAQKIEEFYGVKQIGEEVVFAAKFESAKKVLIGGDFNGWSAISTPMQSDRPGVWRVSLPLPPGRYRYRFVVDGKWMTDPNNQYVEANQFGELNNVIEVD